MALFKKKNKEEANEKEKITAEKEAPTKKKAGKNLSNNDTTSINLKRNLQNIIKKPRITEKTVLRVDSARAYTFSVDEKATKKDVKEAVEKIYNVVPVKVNMTKIPRKAVGVRRGKGFKNGGKKAVVYLKKGDKIDFV